MILVIEEYILVNTYVNLTSHLTGTQHKIESETCKLQLSTIVAVTRLNPVVEDGINPLRFLATHAKLN